MRRRAVTLVEIAVVMLIFTLLVHGAVELLSLSSQRFTQQEQGAACLAEAGHVIAQLRRDTEDMTASGSGPLTLDEGYGIAGFKDGTLVFRSGPEEIAYRWKEAEKTLYRVVPGREKQMARGMVTRFFVTLQMLDTDGALRSSPPDPDWPGPEPVPTVPPPRVVRAWLKVFLTLEQGHGGPGHVSQDYVFRLFPVRLNRRLHSIWLTRDF